MQPHGIARQSKASQQIESECGTQYHRTIQKELPGNDHMIGHDRQNQGSQYTGILTIKQAPQTINNINGKNADGYCQQAGGQITHAKVKQKGQHELEQQGMSAKDRENLP